jgi:hypothetical protein
LAKELLRLGIPEKRLVKLDDVFGKKAHDFEMEDVLSADFYHAAVLSAYPSQQITMPQPGNRKRTSVYEESFRRDLGIGFNKKRVAEAVKKLLSEGRDDKETADNLGMLATAIVERLSVINAEAKEAAKAK